MAMSVCALLLSALLIGIRNNLISGKERFIMLVPPLVLFEHKNYNEYVGGAEMDYMTLKEASEKWGVSPRRINYYCTAGRIPGAVKMATIWLLPQDAEKPIDGRTKQGKEFKVERI